MYKHKETVWARLGVGLCLEFAWVFFFLSLKVFLLLLPLCLSLVLLLRVVVPHNNDMIRSNDITVRITNFKKYNNNKHHRNDDNKKNENELNQ